MVAASPWWVYIVVGGIIVSGYLSYKYTKEDKQIEDRWIEQEGEVFMEPIRKRRQNKGIVNE
ncbi:SigE-dependent sporulation protein [Anaerobacillus arseniciselenatis]|uniref:SigE-dependent sporulation protein n=1 Tax=Anaerobacillus arseniciselenatis TaxID=85682 RepID=A0A1S2LHW5_9BACI|nr:SigE-dependent sporulation protein [Anaerobacillus arseniciselenatis]